MVATACLKNQNKWPVRLMFQDEARFGRLSNPRSCWAPAPLRPMVNRAIIREFRYEYAAVSPWDGALDYMTAEQMNTDNMSHFLNQVSKTHDKDYMIMVLDGASSHKCKDLVVPENINLVFLPPYSPELNPAEQIWNMLRRNYFANRVFDSLNASTLQAETGLQCMSSDQTGLHSLTNWPWINAILKEI
jgi:transposase